MHPRVPSHAPRKAGRAHAALHDETRDTLQPGNRGIWEGRQPVAHESLVRGVHACIVTGAQRILVDDVGEVAHKVLLHLAQLTGVDHAGDDGDTLAVNHLMQPVELGEGHLQIMVWPWLRLAPPQLLPEQEAGGARCAQAEDRSAGRSGAGRHVPCRRAKGHNQRDSGATPVTALQAAAEGTKTARL